MMGFGLVGLVLMIAFWGGLILLVLWGVRGLFSSGGAGQTAAGDGASAHQILNRRYARGEITRDQYELMKRDLMTGG